MNHTIKVEPVGSRLDDKFVVVLDGHELNGLMSHAEAVKMSDFLRANLTLLEGIL